MPLFIDVLNQNSQKCTTVNSKTALIIYTTKPRISAFLIPFQQIAERISASHKHPIYRYLSGARSSILKSQQPYAPDMAIIDVLSDV